MADQRASEKFERALQAPPASAGRDLAPGEARTVLRAGLPPLVIYRSTRDYVFDLADAYNAGRSDRALEAGLLWFVNEVRGEAGELAGLDLKLGIDDEWSRKHRKRIESRRESERARANRHSLEAARRARNEPDDERDTDEN